MAVTVADLLEPKGRISGHLFPGESEATLTARVTEYLTQAIALGTARAVVAASADRFTRAWAYHLAFGDAATRLVLLPASQAKDGEGSASYTASQLAEVRRLADQYRAEADGYVPLAADGMQPPARWASTSVALAPTW